jgi:hypothetical protein
MADAPYRVILAAGQPCGCKLVPEGRLRIPSGLAAEWGRRELI